MVYFLVLAGVFFGIEKLHEKGKLVNLHSAMFACVVVLFVWYLYLMYAMLGVAHYTTDYSYKIKDYRLTELGVEFETTDGKTKYINGDAVIIDEDDDEKSIEYKLSSRDVETWQNIMFFDYLFIGMWERDIALDCIIYE